MIFPIRIYRKFRFTLYYSPNHPLPSHKTAAAVVVNAPSQTADDKRMYNFLIIKCVELSKIFPGRTHFCRKFIFNCWKNLLLGWPFLLWYASGSRICWEYKCYLQLHHYTGYVDCLWGYGSRYSTVPSKPHWLNSYVHRVWQSYILVF